MIYLLLFWEFFKTGLFTIGGGLATLPFLSQMGDRYGWFTQEELTNMLAVSESTPGPIGVNMATYVGNSVGGLFGGVLATFALILPSFLIIYFVAKILLRFKSNQFVASSMEILRPASVGMIAAAILGVLKAVLFHAEALAAGNWSGILSWTNVLIFAVLLGIYWKWNKKLHPVALLTAGAVIGILLKL